MSTPSLKRGRRLQFGIRGLLLMILISSILAGWWADRRRLLRQLEASQAVRVRTSWHESQAAGPPNTNRPGDIPTAWASATQDGQKEWLEITYAKTLQPKTILIYETYNPGAVYKVTAFDRLGREILIWRGVDPTRPPALMGVSKIPAPQGKKKLLTNRVKIYIDSPAVPGWNEIDAVGVADVRTGKVHWGESVKSSSTYGQGSSIMFGGILPTGAMPSGIPPAVAPGAQFGGGVPAASPFSGGGMNPPAGGAADPFAGGAPANSNPPDTFGEGMESTPGGRGSVDPFASPR